MATPLTAVEIARRSRLVREQEKSGLSQDEFCRHHRLSLHAFRVFKYRREDPVLRRASPPSPRMIPVRLLESVATPSIEVELGRGRTIRVRPGFDEATFVRLVAVLERAEC